MRDKFKGLLDPVDPRSPPQKPSPELQEWGWNTSVLSLFTATASGTNEFMKQRQAPVRVPPHLPPALHDIYFRNQQSGRVAKVASRALAGYLYGMVFGSMFYGIDILAGIGRDKRDAWNTALAGCSSGCFFGALLPGTPAFRMSRACLGSAAGTLLGGFVGYLSHDLVQSLDNHTDRQKVPCDSRSQRE